MLYDSLNAEPRPRLFKTWGRCQAICVFYIPNMQNPSQIFQKLNTKMFSKSSYQDLPATSYGPWMSPLSSASSCELHPLHIISSPRYSAPATALAASSFSPTTTPAASYPPTPCRASCSPPFGTLLSPNSCDSAPQPALPRPRNRKGGTPPRRISSWDCLSGRRPSR